MILKYNKFVHNLNEQQEWSEIRNLLGKLLSDIDDELKNDVSDLTNSLINNKNPNRLKTIINNFFRNHEQKIKTIIDDSDSLEELNTVFIDNLKSIYGSIISVNNSLEEEITFDKIFEGSPQSIKRLFDEDEKKFDRNVKQFSIELISELSTRFGFNRDTVISTLSGEDTLSDKEQKEQISQATGEEIEVEDDTNLEGLKNEILKWFNQVIYKKINDFIRSI